MKKTINSLCVLTAAAFTLWGNNGYATATVNVAPTSSIQAAINSVIASGGGTVNITSGVGTIYSEMTTASSVAIYGAGNPTTTLNIASSSAGCLKSPSAAWSNMALENIKINGAGSTVAQEGVDFGGTGSSNSGGKYSNVQVLNTGYGAALLACNTGNVSGSCNFHNSGMTNLYHGLYFSGGSGTVITGNTCTNSPAGSGIHINNWAVINGLSLTSDTTSSNGQEGESFTASTSDQYVSVTISSCTSNSNVDYGFYLGAGSGSIKSCTATSDGLGGYYYGAFTESGNK